MFTNSTHSAPPSHSPPPSLTFSSALSISHARLPLDEYTFSSFRLILVHWPFPFPLSHSFSLPHSIALFGLLFSAFTSHPYFLVLLLFRLFLSLSYTLVFSPSLLFLALPLPLALFPTRLVRSSRFSLTHLPFHSPVPHSRLVLTPPTFLVHLPFHSSVHLFSFRTRFVLPRFLSHPLPPPFLLFHTRLVLAPLSYTFPAFARTRLSCFRLLILTLSYSSAYSLSPSPFAFVK